MFQIESNSLLCQNINCVDLFLLYFVRAKVDPMWQGTVTNPFLTRLFYIISGDAIITVDKCTEIRMEAGNWYLLPAGRSFSYCCDGEMEHLGFQLKLCDIDGIDLFRDSAGILPLADKKNRAAFFMQMLDRHKLLDGLMFRQEIYALLFDFIKAHRITLPDRTLSPCVTKAITYIRKNLSVQLTTAAVAEATLVSVSTLVKHFKSELSMSVHDYIYEIVMTEAAQALLKSNLLVMHISENFGFCDQFYFSRRFREKFGISPRAYRKANYV